MPIHSHQVVSEIMSQPALVIGPDWTVSEVFALAERKHAHHFPILERGVLVGIVCTCDLRDAPPAKPVRDYAHRDVATVSPTVTAAEAARVMAQRAVGSAVVVDGDGICGIVTREDLQGSRTHGEDPLVDAHCAACGSSSHLRSGPDGAFLCADCRDRAHDENWFDTGGGD